MKKIIGILGVAVIAVAMFFSTNNVNGSTVDSSLANLLTLNSANAECTNTPGANRGRCLQNVGSVSYSCVYTSTTADCSGNS
jgi:hypothetical protein